MNPKTIIPIIMACCFAFLFLLQPALFATQNSPAAVSLAVFSNEPRPTARFDHDKHEQAFEEDGCGKCHHSLDTTTNTLVYEEGEEMACSECHTSEKNDEILSFQEANHASCTGCHRTLKKEKKSAGPTTCGECHQK